VIKVSLETLAQTALLLAHRETKVYRVSLETLVHRVIKVSLETLAQTALLLDLRVFRALMENKAYRVSKVLLATMELMELTVSYRVLLDLQEKTVLTVLTVSTAHRVAETYTHLAQITSQPLTHSLPECRAIKMVTLRELLLA